MTSSPSRQRASARWLLLVQAPAVALLVAVWVAAGITGRAPSRFTQDPATLLGSHPFVGVVSNVGIVLWAATAAITLFTALVLQSRAPGHHSAAFLGSAGVLTCGALLDDLFLFHEELLPTVLGVPQAVFLVAYAGALALFLLHYRGLVLRTDYGLLVLTLAWFAVSLGVDQFPHTWFAWKPLYLVEDGAKLLGIAGWLGYFGRVSALTLLSEQAPAVQ